MTTKQPALNRQTFTTSRELEYFSESELVAQTGYPRDDWWPRVLVKESADNSLDACEQTEAAAPEIHVCATANRLSISDNGPGLPAAVITRILDFSTRTSDKAAYVSPTRGAQGNALKTLFALPFVLNQGSPSTVVIEARGVRHSITVSTDHVARRPEVQHQKRKIAKNEGTSICFTRDSASVGQGEDSDFLQKLVFDYSLFNPHATFTLWQDGQEFRFPGTIDGWRKWKSSDPTPAHWYNAERFEELISCCVAAERIEGRQRTVRDFVSEFRGLTSTAKQTAVVAGAHLERTYLRDLITKDGIDRQRVAALLERMQQASSPVKPESLGVLGEDYFKWRLASGHPGETFRYKKITGVDRAGLPFVAECAFAKTDDPMLQGCHVGLNWSVPLSNPIQDTIFDLGKKGKVYGLDGLLARNRITLDSDPVCFVLHLIYPRFNFTDRGKGSVNLTFGQEVAQAVLLTTQKWAAIKKAQERDAMHARRLEERYTRGPNNRITVRDAAFHGMEAAYLKASHDKQYSPPARQVMYAARPNVQEFSGQFLNDAYYTQKLLPEFCRANPALTADWDVVYDARGHFHEPHTSQQFGIGTVEVRAYLADVHNHSVDVRVFAPQLPTQFPTVGPRNRFSAVLYIEKEGFLPLLKQARFAERYDLAIMSSKGMGTTAARDLIGQLCGDVRILVLHDFDKSGFSIIGTLTRDTRRYRHTRATKVTDLGLRLADVEAWGLQTEDVVYRADPAENLRKNGATEDEIEFLRGDYSRFDCSYKGRRVELNAFTSDQFVAWLETKLSEQGIEKVIPDGATLTQAYKRSAATLQLQGTLNAEVRAAEEYAEQLEVPKNLARMVQRELLHDPTRSWDQAIQSLVAAATISK